jgi:glycosyltransferase involved in cell wall biosynthesis
MNIYPKNKFALLSHILPPSPSGQAMMLYRLLSGLPADSYCLISRGNYKTHDGDKGDSRKLPGRCYSFKPVFRLPAPNNSKLFAFNIFFNALLGIYSRAKQIKKILQKEGCNLLIACTGGLYDLPAAYLASKWTGIPFVPYIFDDYAYQWTGFYRSISKRLEPVILKHAKTVIVTNEYMQKEYILRYGVQSTVIHNPCPLPNLEELDKADRVFNNHEINIVYTGAIYHAHYDAFRNLIVAIQQLKRSDVKLHLYTAQPESELIRNGISGPMVVYHSHINQSEVPKVLRQATFLFLPLAFDSPIPEVIKTSAPGKIGEYLSVGRPILVHAPHDSFLSWYFRTNHCGIIVDKNDIKILSQEINKLISDDEIQMELGRHARSMAERDFSIDKMQANFLGLLKLV